MRVIGAAVRDKAGRITHVHGAAQDTTEQRKTEEQLRLSAAVFDNTSEGVLITDTTPKIIAINRAFTEINGYAAEDVLGRSPGLLNSGRHEPGFYAALWSELLAQGHLRGEIWNRRKDGEIYPQWVNINAVRYQARESGGNTYRHYARGLTDYARERVTLTSELNRAIERNELILHDQPLVETATGRITGLEALVRRQHPERGMLFPDSFIRVAEDTGLIMPLGAWVMRRACLQAREWEAAGLPFGRIAVNVSGLQIQRSDFAQTLASILHETGLDAARIELELTETFVMDLRQDAPRLLGDLKRLGIAMAMDDFGTGYSSLAYLKGLPFDTLKIDRSFVSELPDDPASAAIATAITKLGNFLGFDVLAEGVETEAQRWFLLGVGCRRAQGYLFSPPVSLRRSPCPYRRSGIGAVTHLARPRAWSAHAGFLRTGHDSVMMGLYLRRV